MRSRRMLDFLPKSMRYLLPVGLFGGSNIVRTK
jgi:hypothetical protein